jgi:hypothetical protein
MNLPTRCRHTAGPWWRAWLVGLFHFLHLLLDPLTPRYLTHYNGWNKNWDEWVTQERMLKDNEVNREKQLRLVQVAKQKKDDKRKSVPSCVIPFGYFSELCIFWFVPPLL